jgi:hypothetical protein
MKYAPGSFSKNFAWHGTGFRKLHIAIRRGFHSKLQAVARQAWRHDSGINDRNLELVPINFFLHNRSGQMLVDELVFQAIQKPHSLRFDRLALFAFHLNRAGMGAGVVPRPAMWANEFVRERLWRDDAWHSSALSESEMDSFISTRLDAAGIVLTKCRSNYRHLFELSEYLPAKLDLINSGVEHWIGSALFLAWDRSILQGGAAAKSDLLEVVEADELHKLMGTSVDYVSDKADRLSTVYLDAGNLGRFALPEKEALSPKPESSPASVIVSPSAIPATPDLPEELTGEWIEQEESDATVQRQTREVQAQLRDRRKAAALRRHYDNVCNFCQQKLQVGFSHWYSEAAHIRPLGKPHNGPDRISNMLVLCPNHHLQFDRGVLRMRKAKEGFVLYSEVIGDPLNGQPVMLDHEIDDGFVSYHWNWFTVDRR